MLCHYQFLLFSRDSPKFSDCLHHLSIDKLVVVERVDHRQGQLDKLATS